MKDDRGISSDALEAMNIVADNILQARKARLYSQEDMAKACNIALGTYAAVEKGSLSPGMGAYVKVLDHLGLAASMMFMGASQFDVNGQTLRRCQSR
ncbi:MAG: XRE family transcriptional regulator [Gammaproteobacteria bacterium]|nr:MAG: XRE family transcriptional regulator [Gammaproteobacteria bacterium]